MLKFAAHVFIIAIVFMRALSAQAGPENVRVVNNAPNLTAAQLRVLCEQAVREYEKLKTFLIPMLAR
jgi:hypothetical protein